MRRFFCDCGQEIFLENQICTGCGKTLAYQPASGKMVTINDMNGVWRLCSNDQIVKLCLNRQLYGVCNAIVDLHDSDEHCIACRLNRTIPDLSKAENLARWAKLEVAKRRLLHGLLSMGLPLQAPVKGFPRGLCFDFLEDKRSNPDAAHDFVATGHHEGVVTINVLEADEVQRVWQREQSSERYRTLLGHLRHEAGHYYFELLVQDMTQFAYLFGDPNQPYHDALNHYYEQGPLAGWQQTHISAYASSHPSEDWAECFAHYLHITDTLETAVQRGAIMPVSLSASFDELLSAWGSFAVTLNELNRSLGLRDAYPFVVTAPIAEKLHFIHAAIAAYPGSTISKT